MGGTAFTPIINAPEVAIMGVSRAAMKPVHMDGRFEPRLLLPFTVSYDHRVIDGVAAAEFAHYISTLLADIREILL
ncbi:Dihydrolipoyllysine-residue acetyltransferase component of pyruvate dehydrogenase complex [compost metagenome]